MSRWLHLSATDPPAHCLSGGFGGFSKNYGLAAAGLLEAEVVTADGVVHIAQCLHKF